MSSLPQRQFPLLYNLPVTLPREGAVRIELEEGVPVFRASGQVQQRIEDLLHRHAEGKLAPEEAEELDRYEDIDDYLSLLNRIVRNQHASV